MATFEESRFTAFRQRAKPEEVMAEDSIIWNQEGLALATFLGFEERTVSLLRKVADWGKSFRAVHIFTYAHSVGSSRSAYEEELFTLARKVSKDVRTVTFDRDWAAIQRKMSEIDCDILVFDFTSVANRFLFGLLNVVSSIAAKVILACSEARSYWPTKTDISRLRSCTDPKNYEAAANDYPWLYGVDYVAEAIDMFEGIHSPGYDCFFYGFMPFKSVRLGTVISEVDNAFWIAIVGEPRTGKLRWRQKALRELNTRYVARACEEVSIPTFGYLNTVDYFQDQFFGSPRRLRQNIVIATLGSKLHNLGVWSIASLVPSVKLITSVPTRYFDNAFSSGTGLTWLIDVIEPMRRTREARPDFDFDR